MACLNHLHDITCSSNENLLALDIFSKQAAWQKGFDQPLQYVVNEQNVPNDNLQEDLEYFQHVDCCSTELMVDLYSNAERLESNFKAQSPEFLTLDMLHLSIHNLSAISVSRLRQSPSISAKTRQPITEHRTNPRIPQSGRCVSLGKM